MTRQFFWVAVAAMLGLGGCSTSMDRQGAPAPVEQSAGGAKPPAGAENAAAPEISVRAYEPAPAVTPAPVHSGAVVALLGNADRQRQAGDISGAVATTERALRIEPRNAHLWNRLAHLRHAQGRYEMASDIAAKSNDLSGGDLSLQRDNWRLIADCRRALGDPEGARRAERSARMLR